jgi:hypothetical protein
MSQKHGNLPKRKTIMTRANLARPDMACPNAKLAEEIYELLIRRHPSEHGLLGCESVPDANHAFCRHLESELDRLANECTTERGCTEDWCPMGSTL